MAQPTVQPEAITIEDGLSQGYISCMLQDREGFLWFGTKNGLNRYDGEHFQIFTYDPDNPYSIAGDYIGSLYEVGDFLIVGLLNSKGLNIFHKQSRRFYNVRIKNSSVENKEDFNLEMILKDSLGQFWGYDRINQNLVRFQFPDGFWEALLLDEPVLNEVEFLTIPFPNILHLKLNKAGKSFTMMEHNLKKLWKFDVQTLSKEDRTPSPTTADRRLTSIVLVGTDTLTAFEKDKASEYFSQSYTLKDNRWQWQGEGFKEWTRTTNFWTEDLFPVMDWFTADLYFFEKSRVNGELLPLSDAVFKVPSQQATYNCMMTNSTGIIWLGTSGSGVRKLIPRSMKIKTYFEGLSIYAPPYATADGEIILGGSEEISSVIYKPGKETKFLKNGIHAHLEKWTSGRINDGENGTIWFAASVWGKFPIYQIQKNGRLSKEPVFSLPAFATAFDKDDDGMLYFAGNGFFATYIPETKQLKEYDLKKVIDGNFIAYALKRTKNGHWWMATSKGLLQCIPTNMGFDFKLIQANDEQTTEDGQNSAALLNNDVAALLTDPKDGHVLWLGTKGGGLHRLDTRTMKFTYLTTKNSLSRNFGRLPNDIIYGILNDDHGNLWMSSNKGLIRYNPTTGVIRNYTKADGLQSNEFNTWAFAKTPTGELMFGGINGLNVFHPDDFQDNPIVPNVRITALSVNNQPVEVGDTTDILQKSIEFTPEITLPFSQNSITLQFAALDFTTPKKNLYQYYLEGAEAPWTHETTQNEVSYFTLSPGDYTFKIKGTNGDGVWNEEPTELKITILPPWYRSNLAYLFYAILIGWAIWQFLKFQKKRLRLHHRIELEQKEAERLKELDQFKSRLYTNITHEFRTPLTVISGMAEQMAGDEKSKQLIKRNSDQLLNLVNQMLDLRKLESGNISIQKIQGDIVRHIRYLTESLKSYAEMQGLTVHFLSDQPKLLMDFDPEKMTRIHSNLLSNAIKFTQKGGDIYVQILVETFEATRRFVLKVKDTGVGIPEEKLPHIFERFYQVDDSSTRQGEGTGIGLTLVSELVKAMGGDIKVASAVSEGTTFTIRLPITNLAEMADAAQKAPDTTIAAPILSPLNSNLEEAIESKGQGSTKPTVLIVEDNADVIHYLINCLQEHYSIEIAMNGEEGINKALEHVPEIIVSDVMMPVKDGFELCQTLKTDERTSHIPIILLTAKADMESRLEGLQRGADAYLSKPFHREELLVILQSQLTLRQRLQARFRHLPGQSPSLAEPVVSPEAVEEMHLHVEDAFLKKIRDLVEKDLSDNELGMPQLMRGLGMSRSQIYKKVKALTGASPSRYIRSVRLHHAKKLLEATDLNVSEVAYETGFSSPVYFSEVFLEEFGIRPKETRK